jgi:Ca-activated chloride channel family protein
VKIQVEFNPSAISEYRLIGYETRLLQREDFNNDSVDAGEIGSGHTVTALYEVTPNGSPAELVDNLRYQGADGDGPPPGTAAEVGAGEYGFLKIRYKLPAEDTSRLIETPIRERDQAGGAAPREARFAASVAAFGQILRGGRYTGDFDHDDVIALAQANKGEDEFGYRAEFINLVRLAKSAASMEPQRP